MYDSSVVHRNWTRPLRASTLARPVMALDKVLQRPAKPSYRMCPAQMPSDVLLFGDVDRYMERTEGCSTRVAAGFEVKVQGTKQYRRLDEMYKWAEIEAFQVSFEEQIFDETVAKRVDILSIRRKELQPHTPIIVISHGSKQDLGSIVHFLVDMVAQIKCQVVAYEYPGFGGDTERTTEDTLIKYQKECMSYVQQKAHRQSSLRPVFLFGIREGAIVSSLLAIDYQHILKGIILQDPLIIIEKRGLLFRRGDNRYLKMLGELRKTSFLLFHGMLGKTQPFAQSKAIIEECCGRQQVLKEQKRTEQTGTFGKSTLFKSEHVPILFETYFVECDNGQLRQLKRPQFYRKLRTFLDDLKELATSFHGFKTSLRPSTSRQEKKESQEVIVPIIQNLQDASTGSMSDSSVRRSTTTKIYEITPKFKAGRDFTLRTNFSQASPILLKGLKQRKLTFDTVDTLLNEEEEEESGSFYSPQINLVDPRAPRSLDQEDLDQLS